MLARDLDARERSDRWNERVKCDVRESERLAEEEGAALLLEEAVPRRPRFEEGFFCVGDFPLVLLLRERFLRGSDLGVRACDRHSNLRTLHRAFGEERGPRKTILDVFEDGARFVDPRVAVEESRRLRIGSECLELRRPLASLEEGELMSHVLLLERELRAMAERTTTKNIQPLHAAMLARLAGRCCIVLPVPELVPPLVDVHASFLEAVAEFRAEGRGEATDASLLGRELRRYGSSWSDPEVFAAYAAALRADSIESTPRPEGWVPATTLWYVDGASYIGRIAIRHRLTPSLLEVGGHMGYDVRPSQRRRGHATRMLRAALPVAASLGIESALVTCDDDNIGSRRVIEANGGQLEDQRGNKLRFWVRTA
jgi:predicted acetyltransferase